MNPSSAIVERESSPLPRDLAPSGSVERNALALLLNRYRQHLELRNYSPLTLETQATYFQRLREFLDEAGVTEVQAITTEVLQRFQQWLFYRPTERGTTRTVRSQNRALSTLKSFFAFLHREGYLPRDPARELQAAREPDDLPKDILTPQEAKRIIEKPDTGTLMGYRDRTILEVLYATGIRKQELMNLRVEDVNLEEELLRINRGKGGKDRVVPLSRAAGAFLENYLKAVRPELLKHQHRFPVYFAKLKERESGLVRRSPDASRNRDEGGLLFLSIRGGPLGEHSLSHLVAKYARLAKVRKKVTPHLWRHTCATHLLKNNANLRHVQEILGHRSLATTEKYLRLTITDLKAAHRKFHPRERGIENDE